MTDAPQITEHQAPQAETSLPPVTTIASAHVDGAENTESTGDAGNEGGTQGGDRPPRTRRSRGGRGKRRNGPSAPIGETAEAAGVAESEEGAEQADGAQVAVPAVPANAPRQQNGRHGQQQRKPQQPTAGDARQAREPREGRNNSGQGQQAARNKAHPVLERLFALYPKMFGARFLPLKLGVYQDLVERHGEEFKTEDLKLALGLHARSTRYLDAVAAGHQRHNLEAEPVEPVAPEHVHHAILETFRRRQARTKDDLGEQLRERIIAAIESSNIGREAYAERVRARDPQSNAALDDALTELGRQAAKREALLRAFEASGKSEAEFADMYGMDSKEVTRTLQRARKDKKADAEAAAAKAAEAAKAETEAPEIEVPEAGAGDEMQAESHETPAA
ncbi:ProQ/FINO family protein [Variovorax sp. RHLX14]|uniref:ProQ/FINO family protein n=1 Tax=Variovorax sp. RHLX14 TaxID=1259731 RepID=UPI003F47B5A5